MKGKKGSKEDVMLLCKYLLKYRSWSRKSALHELFNIDFIKNNYTWTTIYSYFTYINYFIKEGIHCKQCPPMMRECLNHLVKVTPREEFIEISPEAKVKKEVNSLEEVNRKLELLEKNYEKARQDNETEFKRINILLRKYNERVEAIDSRYDFWKNKLTEEKNQLVNQELDELLQGEYLE